MASSAVAATEWQEVIHDKENDIIVYQRRLDSGLPEFKGITHIDSTLHGCVALIRDVDSMPEWVSRTIMAKVLRRISDTEVIAYHVSRVEWPFRNRDAIVHTRLEQDPKTLAITIRGQSLSNYDGPSDFDFHAIEKQYHRMSDIRSSWTFIPKPDGRIEVIFQGAGNPGGHTSMRLIRWIMKLVVSESPYQTLKNMRQIIGRSKYQQARFDFVTDVGSVGR